MGHYRWATEVYIDINSDEALDEIGENNILKYCYKNNLIEPEKDEEGNPIYPKLGQNKEVKSPNEYFIHSSSIAIDSDEALDAISDEDIRQYCLDHDLVGIEDFLDDDDDYSSQEQWIKAICNQYKKITSTKRVLTKDDYKKELVELIDLWMN